MVFSGALAAPSNKHCTMGYIRETGMTLSGAFVPPTEGLCTWLRRSLAPRLSHGAPWSLTPPTPL